MNITKVQLDEQAFLLENFLSPQECQWQLNRSESIGYAQATITTTEGQKMIKGIRNNQRIVVDDADLANMFWERVSPFVSPTEDGWIPTSVKPDFRFYKYAPGQKFNRHIDGRVKHSDTMESRLTLMVYLNDDFNGGETEFNNFTVIPKAGTALVFAHEMKHKGCEVLSGIKYALRTDIMFSKPT